MLKGKNAIVTGSTSGIGLAIAHALGKEGCNIMLNGFGDAALIEWLRKELPKQYSIRALYSPADMSKPEQVRAMASQCEKELGGVDILVNNAGIQHTASIEEFPQEKWEAILAINLSAAFYAIQSALPGMRARNFGRIINIASVHGLVASKNKSAYVAAKHGLVGLTKATALEVAEADITCNAICPGWVHTPLVQKQIDDRARAEGISEDAATIALIGEKQPNKRFIHPEQIGALVVYLCSETGNAFNGAALPIDGGWTAQ